MSSPDDGTQNISRGKKKKRKVDDGDSSEVSLITKYLLFVFNFIFTVAGVVLVAVSILLLAERNNRTYESINVIMDMSVFFCVAGFIASIVSTIGCWGALRENTLFITIYKNIVLLLMLSELILLGIAILYIAVEDVRTSIKIFPEESFRKSMFNYADDKTKGDDDRYFVDNIHLSLKCCGLSNNDEGYKDWGNVPDFRCQNSTHPELACSVPITCCRNKAGENLDVFCGMGILQLGFVKAKERIYTQGCLQAFYELVDKNKVLIICVFLAVMIPQVILHSLGERLINQIYRQKAKWDD